MHQRLPVLSWHGDIHRDEVINAIKAIEEVLLAHDYECILCFSVKFSLCPKILENDELNLQLPVEGTARIISTTQEGNTSRAIMPKPRALVHLISP